jgi:drug/metabolite transporter (DMT)-like permease
MTPPRRAAVVIVWGAALGLLGTLLAATWGLTSEYGSAAADTAVLAVLPLAVAVVAAGIGSFTRVSVVALIAFAVVTVVGLPVSAELGERHGRAGGCDDDRARTHETGRAGRS